MQKITVYLSCMALSVCIFNLTSYAQSKNLIGLRDSILSANLDHFKKVKINETSDYKLESVTLFKDPINIHDTIYDGIVFRPSKNGFLYWAFFDLNIDGWYLLGAKDSLSTTYFQKVERCPNKDYIIQRSSRALNANEDYLLWFRRNNAKAGGKYFSYSINLTSDGEEAFWSFFAKSYFYDLLFKPPTKESTALTNTYKAVYKKVCHWDKEGGVAHMGEWTDCIESNENCVFEINATTIKINFTDKSKNATFTIESYHKPYSSGGPEYYSIVNDRGQHLSLYVDKTGKEIRVLVSGSTCWYYNILQN